MPINQLTKSFAEIISIEERERAYPHNRMKTMIMFQNLQKLKTL